MSDVYAGTAGSRHAADMGARSGLVEPPRAVNPSCFGNIEDVTSTCSSVAQRVERTVARLCGDYPAAESKPAQGNSPNGLFDAADRQAHDIRESMSRITRALDILDKATP